jgi:LacI family transcriptional regulator
MQDVANLANVGLMTVSRVVNNRPTVNAATRKRVLAAINTLGFRENEAARLLKGRRAMIIGLIVPDFSDSFFAACAHTVQQVARQNGYMTLVTCSDSDSRIEVQEAELMAIRKISGLLVVTSTTGEDHRLQQLQETGLSIVAMDRPLKGIKTDTVVVENRAASGRAVRHLIEHGHRHIACVGAERGIYTMVERVGGYSDAMREAGLVPDIAANIDSLESTRLWIARAMASVDPPTAIFALNHRSSTWLLHAFSEVNIAVGRDMALIGFDDFDLAPLMSPPLTAVSQSPVELTKRAMALLLDRIRLNGKEEAFTPATIMLPVTLAIRASCGCNAKAVSASQ